VREIYDEVRPFIKSNEYFDILSHCYVEFLKYANNDSGLGIVLTPAHIAELFCDIANVNCNSVVFDNCCGTSSFLAAAMQKMVNDAAGDKEAIE
jgi:type I restriction enzyme M protein